MKSKSIAQSRELLLMGKILALLAAALLTACAPPPPQSADGSPALTAAIKSALAASTSNAAGMQSDASWSCPISDNVTLKDNINYEGFDYTGTDDFLVCSAKTNGSRSQAFSYKISGSTQSSSICVYPMYTGYSSSLMLMSTPQCFPVTGSPIIATFSATAINYILIVDENYTDALAECLSGSSSCPPHAEGLVQ